MHILIKAKILCLYRESGIEKGYIKSTFHIIMTVDQVLNYKYIHTYMYINEHIFYELINKPK